VEASSRLIELGRPLVENPDSVNFPVYYRRDREDFIWLAVVQTRPKDGSGPFVIDVSGGQFHVV
jgi:hypothetical protein